MTDKNYLSDEELMNLIAEVEENEMVEAPFYLKGAVMERARAELKPLAAVPDRQSAKIQLLSYSFKVGLATAAAIAVLMLAPAELKLTSPVIDNYTSESETLTEKINGKSNELCELFAKMTNSLVGKEDMKNEKAEKE